MEVDAARPDRTTLPSETKKSPSKAPYWVTFDLEDEAEIVARLTVEDREASQDAYRAGMQALEAGDYEAAVEHFVASHQRHPGPAQKWRIARSLDKLGRWEEAALSYRWFIASEPGAAYLEHLDTANERIAVFDWAKPPAVAPASPADLAEARQSFQRGIVDFQNGSYQRAREAFMRAHALAAKPPVLLNIAICELKLNLKSRACRTYRRYLAEAGGSAHRSSQLDAQCGP